MIKIVHVVLHEKERKLEVAIEDKVGRKRVVTIVWESKEFTPVPDNWLEQVVMEIDFQDSEETAALQGRALFR